MSTVALFLPSSRLTRLTPVRDTDDDVGLAQVFVPFPESALDPMMASLLHIGHYATTTSVVDWVIAATVNLVETFVSQSSSLSSNELCTTLPLISELVGTLCQRLSGPQGVVDVCKLMITMMKHASIVEHFSTPQIAASFVAMARFATTPDSTACFSLAVCSIVDENESAQLLLANSDVRCALTAMSAFATTPYAAACLSSALCKIVVGNPTGMALFATETVLSALCALSTVVDRSGVTSVLSAFQLLWCDRAHEDSLIVATDALRRALSELECKADRVDIPRIESVRRRLLGAVCVDEGLTSMFVTMLGQTDIFSAQCCWNEGAGGVLSSEVSEGSPAWTFVTSRARDPPRRTGQFYTTSRILLVRREGQAATFLKLHDQELTARGDGSRLRMNMGNSEAAIAAIETLKGMFEEKVLRSRSPAARILFAWYGVETSSVNAVCRHGPRNFGTTDLGFFGSGTYFSREAAYASRYSKLDDNGEGAVILFAISVSQAYPVTIEADYRTAEEEIPFTSMFNGMYDGFSRFYPTDPKNAIALQNRCDAHFIPVKQYGYLHPRAGYQTARDVDYQATHTNNAEYHELVIGSHHRCLPIAVMYFRR